jgi:hypothetical protein
MFGRIFPGRSMLLVSNRPYVPITKVERNAKPPGWEKAREGGVGGYKVASTPPWCSHDDLLSEQPVSSKHQQPVPSPSSLSGEGFSRSGRKPLTFARSRAAVPVATKCGRRRRRNRAPTQCTLLRSSSPSTSPLPFPLPTGHTNIYRREICAKHNMVFQRCEQAFQMPDL